jgi:AcrR family transcriptional regulator
MARTATARRKQPARAFPPAGQVVDAALELAAGTGWYDLPMRTLAQRLGVGLAALAARYRDPDAIADLVFARARDAMLDARTRGSARARVEGALWRWFDALAPHRRVVAQMLRAKLNPSHAHHWAPLPFHLSRLIWWLREAAALDATGRRRQVEEIALSAIFLAALASWVADDSAGQARTRARVGRMLRRAETALGWRALAPRRGVSARKAARERAYRRRPRRPVGDASRR